MSSCRAPLLTLRQRRIRGAGDRGQAESTRTRLLQECIQEVNVANQALGAINTSGCNCPVLASPLVQLPTAPDQLSHTLDIAVACPILYNTPVTSYGCQPTYAAPIPPPTILDVGTVPEPPQGPAVANVYRKFTRISGIDQISKPRVGRAGSDRTAQIRAGIISGSLTRYVQTVLPLVAYPPCPPSPQAGVPQAGVPIAPSSACNPGTRRVDYSNPRA
jgi:hypothetical protein